MGLTHFPWSNINHPKSHIIHMSWYISHVILKHARLHLRATWHYTSSSTFRSFDQHHNHALSWDYLEFNYIARTLITWHQNILCISPPLDRLRMALHIYKYIHANSRFNHCYIFLEKPCLLLVNSLTRRLIMGFFAVQPSLQSSPTSPSLQYSSSFMQLVSSLIFLYTQQSSELMKFLEESYFAE